MKLFWWGGMYALADYNPGDLIVHASSLGEAQELVKKKCSLDLYEEIMENDPEIYGDDESALIEIIGSA